MSAIATSTVHPYVLWVELHVIKLQCSDGSVAEHRSLVQEVVGSNTGWTNTQGLKIIEEKLLPLHLHTPANG